VVGGEMERTSEDAMVFGCVWGGEGVVCFTTDVVGR
jgi:hypothetical protein